MRLIDADKLNIDFYDEYEIEGDVYAYGYVSKHQIDEAPSIDIVRCKECIWRDKDNQGEGYCTYVKGLADINDESFCSWGERKESE